MAAHIATGVRAHLEQTVGADPAWDDCPQVASVTFLGVEPVDVLRFSPVRSGAPVVFATVGCARHPMGDPTEVVADPTTGPRAEVLMSLRPNATGLSGLHTSLATVAAAPAVEGLVLTDDALIDLGEPLWRGASFTAVTLSASAVDGGPEVPLYVLPEPMSAVRFMTAIPVTQTEAAWIRLKGMAAMRDAWQRDGTDLLDPDRPAAQPAP